MPNAYTISFGINTEDYWIVTHIIIKTKHNFDERKWFSIKNRGLSLPEYVIPEEYDPNNTYVIKDTNGNPLFSLNVISYNRSKNFRFDYIGAIFLFFAYVFFLISYWIYDYGFGKKYLTLPYYLLVTAIYVLLMTLLLKVATSYVFKELTFSMPIYYCSNLCASLGNFFVLSIFFVCRLIFYMR